LKVAQNPGTTLWLCVSSRFVRSFSPAFNRLGYAVCPSFHCLGASVCSMVCADRPLWQLLNPWYHLFMFTEPALVVCVPLHASVSGAGVCAAWPALAELFAH
jgi:hypothetical protein